MMVKSPPRALPSADSVPAKRGSPGTPFMAKPTAVPDFILEMRRRGHAESAIGCVVYDNALAFFSQSRNFVFNPPDVAEHAGV